MTVLPLSKELLEYLEQEAKQQGITVQEAYEQEVAALEEIEKIELDPERLKLAAEQSRKAPNPTPSTHP